MSKKKFITPLIAVLLVILIGCLALFLLKENGIIGNSTGSNDIKLISVNYENGIYNTSSATRITTTGGEISIQGAGAAANGNKLDITAGGTYVLSGNFTGQITVNASKQTVTLVLDNATITNDSGAAIYIQEVKRILIASESDTINKITDGKTYSANYGEEDVDAAIYSKDDLIFAGTGTIEITGNYNHAIHSKDCIQLLSGALNITSANDSIVAKDYFAMKDGTLTINSASDGIKTTSDKDASLGYVAFDNGSVKIKSTGDAINSITRISIAKGTFEIETGNGATDTSASNSEWGRWQKTGSKTVNSSAKGLKAEKYIIIANGTFNFNTSDDAIHANTSLQINNGNISIKTGDDAIHADASAIINNGNINIMKSHEGIEATNITINDGSITIVDDDDGLNATGGNDGSSTNGRPGQNNFSGSKGEIHINGGTLSINTYGDGIDSNGMIEMTGGYVAIDGPTNNGNGALDYDSTFNISGGTLIATGSSGMLQTPSESSSQNIISIVFDSTEPADSTFRLKDSSGNTLVEFIPTKNYASVIISTPNLTANNSYTATVDDTNIATLKISDKITSYGSSRGDMPKGAPRR